MSITFDRRYPDFSQVSYCMKHLEYHEARIIPSALLYVALFLNELPADSLLVYSGPYRGWSLVALASFLQKHRVILIENYRGEPNDKYRDLLSESIREVSCEVQLVEEDFVEVWPTLSGVDFLLLDGPPNTTNFNPFSDNFIFMMHDINQRLRDDHPGDSLVPYLPHLCRADDVGQFEDIPDAELHPALKAYRDVDQENPMHKEFGPHAWLIGDKITD